MNGMMFPDVDREKWYAPYVDKVSEAGIMIGDDNGSFRPDEPLSRAEAAVIVCRLLDRMGFDMSAHGKTVSEIDRRGVKT